METLDPLSARRLVICPHLKMGGEPGGSKHLLLEIEICLDQGLRTPGRKVGVQENSGIQLFQIALFCLSWSS